MSDFLQRPSVVILGEQRVGLIEYVYANRLPGHGKAGNGVLHLFYALPA
jgi:hypothetical protein